jgi:hypothetical protein
MKSRSQRPAEERHTRSLAVKHVSENSLLRGSLVTMSRTCGKAGCHCQQGEKHVSLYLAIRQDGRRKMIYIPPAMEEMVRTGVENGREVDQLLDVISQQCLTQFMEQKEENLGRRVPSNTRKKKGQGKTP